MSSKWINQPKDITKYQGFVYLITNLTTGKKYIGKKFFVFKTSKKPLKGRVNKRRGVKESDWKTYWGSNKELQSDVKRLGEDCFRREMLTLCESKFDCAYQEAKLQFELNVLFDNNYYNEVISCRLRRRKS